MMELALKKEYLKIAVDACLTGGNKLFQDLNGSKKFETESRRDVKLKGDKHSEDAIIEYLHKEVVFPILSEERGYIGETTEGGYIWIVDPIDGSFNFFRDIPLCCVSIGLWQNKSPVLGAVYDFNRNELFTGIVNEGAWLNGSDITPSNIKKKENAVLCTGFPVNTDFSIDGIGNFVFDIKAYKKVRLLGSAALSLAYVAAGRADAYYEKDIMLWDVAAGIAILSGAGGKIDIKKAQRDNSFHVNASNGYLSL